MERINKVPVLRDGEICFDNIEEIGEGVYLPYATFVTAAARYITISTAQKCMDDGNRFIYADTDSVHILGNAPEGMWVHPKDLGAWKRESFNPKAKYLRPKTYIHCNADYSVILEEKEHKDGSIELVPEGIKCAGMPDRIKMRIATGKDPEDPKMDIAKWYPKYAWDNFFIGNKFEGKRAQRRVPGGVLITECTYELKEQMMRVGSL